MSMASHKRRNRLAWTLAAASLTPLSGFLGGCAATDEAPGRRGARPLVARGAERASTPVAAPARSAENYTDPVARATLRERALALLSDAAMVGSPEERANAIEALQTTPGRLFPVAVNALADPNRAVRGVAATTVGRARLDAAAQKVWPLTDDSDQMVRASAFYALRRCGQTVDLSPLGRMLMDSSNPRLRAHVAFLLGELGEPSALPMLREAAKMPMVRTEPAVRRVMDLQIAEACVKLGDEAPLVDIRAALFPAKPEDLEATALACQIVGQVQDKAAANSLIQLTAAWDVEQNHLPAEVRMAAAAALARLGQRQGGFVAEEYRASPNDAHRAQAAFVYGETGQAEHLPVLAEMMADPVGRVRVAAAAAVVKITEAAASRARG